MADRSRGADGLRTLACLLVVFHHLSQQLVFNPSIQAPDALKAAADFFTSAGSAGVSVFFVLSGFLLSLPFWRAYREGRSLPDLRVYGMRRAGRILPAFSVNLLFFFVVGVLFNPEAPALLWRYVAGLTFTSGFHWLTFFPAEGNGPLWSIGFEVFSYVLLPLGMAAVFLLFGKKRSLGAALGCWAVLWLLVLAGHQAVQLLFPVEALGKGWQYGLTGGAKEWMPRYNPLGFFGHFALGTLAAGLAVLWEKRGPSRRFDAASLLLTALWAAVLVSRTNQDQFSWTWGEQPYYFPLFAALTALLLACLTQSRRLGGIFDNRFSRRTAQLSFGLYLWHTFVISAFNGAIGDTGEWLLLVAVTLGGAYALAALSWKHLEQPALAWAQSWSPGTPLPRPVWVAAAVLVLVPAAATVFRPSAAELPLSSGTEYAFAAQGPVTGLTGDGEGGWFAAWNGTEIHRVRADKTVDLLYRLSPAAEIRLTLDPRPGLVVLHGERPFLWNLRRGPDGNLYAAAGDRIVVLSPQGRELKSLLFPRGAGPGVMDVAFDGADLLVPDGPQVFRVSPSGERSVLIEDGAFTSAAGLVLTEGRLLLADTDPRHPEQGRILSYPYENSKVGTPEPMAAEGALFGARLGRRVFFSRAFSSRLYEWTPTGVTAHAAPNVHAITALAADPLRPGRLFTAAWDGSIGEIKPRGQP